MRPKKFVFIAVISLLCLQGCHTMKSSMEGASKGLKKDAQLTSKHLTHADGWLRSADAWMQENLW